MYLPAAFREDRLEVLHALIRAHPLATLVSSGAGGLVANLVPFIVVDEERRVLQPNGALQDIAPTILGMLGETRPAEMQGRDLRIA